MNSAVKKDLGENIEGIVLKPNKSGASPNLKIINPNYNMKINRY